MISIPQKHSCEYCNKKYTKKTDLKKHELMCELLHKTEREKQIEEENRSDLPSHNQLCAIVMELLHKNKVLEDKLNQITKWAERQRKKMSITDWLKDNVTPSISYSEFKEQLSHNITQEHVEHLIDNTFIDTIHRVFTSTDCSSLYCTTQKQNVFYIYRKVHSETGALDKWDLMVKEDFVDLLNYMHSKFLRELIKWKRNNNDIISKNEQMSKLYNKMMIKFSEIDFAQDATLFRIKTALHTHLKKDLKNMIEYEFE